MGKRYIGFRDGEGGAATVEVEYDGQRYALDPRFDLVNHSPDGFEFGYNGSGPAQLALAILADHFGVPSHLEAVVHDDALDNLKTTVVLKLYQHFKASVIAQLQGDAFVIDRESVQAAVEEINK